MNIQNQIQTSTEKNEKKEKGASLVEYALLVALIAVICIGAIRQLGRNTSAKFSAISSGLA